jgi:ParB family chromosome partitioning protein
MSRKRFSVRDNRLQEAIGTVLQDQNRAGEGRLENLPLSLVHVAAENPRYVGRITPEEIVAHREGRADLGREQGDRAVFFNSILEMAGSIERRGLLQPIVVKEDETGFCILIGERRYLAHLLLGRERVRAIVRPVSEELEERSIRLIENLQREDLGFAEIIRGIEELDRLFQSVHGKPMDGQDLAAELHKHDSTCRRYLQIVRGPSDIRAAIEEGKIGGLRPALALLDIESPEERKRMLQKLAKGDATETLLRQTPAPVSVEPEPVRRRGRQRRQISLGAVKHPPVIQVLMRSVLGEDAYEQRYGALDWTDLDQIQEAWDGFIETLHSSTK